MSSPTLLPLTEGVRLDTIASSGNAIQIQVTAIKTSAACPLCKRLSERIHSRYHRTLTDLPWGQVTVRVHVRARRFFCDNGACQRRLFAEPLSGLAERYAHKTKRLQAALYLIGYALGGEAGAREALGLGFTVSPDTLLRRVRQVAGRAPTNTTTPVRAVGVDDWAFRKGHRYGTILVDLEKRRLLDLLPDRSAESLQTWLQDHPEIEVISRDRAGCYAEGAAQGAPQAMQVADRWHILHNLTEAMEKLLLRHHRDLRQAAEHLCTVPQVATAEAEVTTPAVASKPSEALLRPITSERQESELRRQRRQEYYEEVHRRHRQGQSQREIARTMGLARDTIRKLLQARAFPERAQPRSLSKPLVAYLPYLTERWGQGCHNIRQLHREIQEKGYRGGYLSVYRHLTGRQSPVPGRPCEVKPVVFAPPSPRATTWLLLKEEGQQPQEAAFVEVLLAHSPAIQQAQALAKEFFAIVRTRNAAQLDAWIERVNASGLSDLQGFARGLQRDRAAVTAGLSQSWSNGQTEGQVNRLKLIKRQMYGRAKFDLLRARVLPTMQAA